MKVQFQIQSLKFYWCYYFENVIHCYRVGVIKAGDRLLAIDGINLSMVTLQEALQILKQLKQTALLTVEYDVSVIGNHFKANICE